MDWNGGAQPSLSPAQTDLITADLSAHIFLEGPAGAGKTTVGAERLRWLVQAGVRPDSILVLTPQRTLGDAYAAVTRQADFDAGSAVTLLTISGLAQRTVELFWPLVAEPAGFAQPNQPPTFLTLETAQYHMARLVRPMLADKAFASVSLDHNRLYSQILDNLNKAAGVRFPPGEIGQRLIDAAPGDAERASVYTDVQTAANQFREYCLAHNLLDFSLQLEVFLQQLWPLPLCRDYLRRGFRHLIADNLEEDVPATHDVLSEWVPECDSALLIYDHDAGYRRFLGADPDQAYTLKDLCEQQVTLSESFVTPPALQAVGVSLGLALARPPTLPEAPAAEPTPEEVSASLAVGGGRFYPQLLDWLTEQIATLVHGQNVPPGEIVVLAPFVSDALRYALLERLQRAEIPARSHRPSRSLRDEPATHCLLTLATLAHPDWGRPLSRFDLAYALVQALAGLDLVRAQLLANIVGRTAGHTLELSSFGEIKPDVQKRITFVFGGRYERLHDWLAAYRQGPPVELDHFLGRLFGEVLSQEGYGFHADFDAAGVTANLIESVQKFRWAVQPSLPADQPLGKEYLEMVDEGVIAAQYLRNWRGGGPEPGQPESAVLIAPAYTFLLSNQAVGYQFWLDVSALGWFERLDQPLTQPYVLSRGWPAGQVWTDADEFHTSQESLYRLALGLLRRCRQKVYLGLSDLGEQGFEQRGPLLSAFQRVFKRLSLDLRTDH